MRTPAARVPSLFPARQRPPHREVPAWAGASGGEPRQRRAGDRKCSRPRTCRTAESLREFAESRGRSLLELAFAWLASRPAVASVIAGAKSPEQATANAHAAEWKLDASEVAAVDRILGHAGQPVP